MLLTATGLEPEGPKNPAFYHIRCPTLAQFRFEWHPGKENVYLVRLGATPEIGEIVAFNITTEGAAINAVMIWARGFREGQTPTLIKPHLAG